MKRKNRILAIDFGKKYVGFAFSSSGIGIKPLGTLVLKDKFFWEKFLNLVKEYSPDLLLLGVPYHFKKWKYQKELRDFQEEIEERTHLPVVLWDESLTSYEAEEVLRSLGYNTKKMRKTLKVHSLSALFLLASYLEEKKRK